MVSQEQVSSNDDVPLSSVIEVNTGYRIPIKYYRARRYYDDLPGLAAQLRADCTGETETLDAKEAFGISWAAIKEHQRRYYCGDNSQVYADSKLINV